MMRIRSLFFILLMCAAFIPAQAGVLDQKPFFRHPLRTPFEQKYHEWSKHQLYPGHSVHPTIGRTTANTCASDDPLALPHVRCIVFGVALSAHY
jgi:hypothetical protein